MRETDQHASPPLPSPAFRKRFERRLWRKTREEFTDNRSLFDGSFSENWETLANPRISEAKEPCMFRQFRTEPASRERVCVQDNNHKHNFSVRSSKLFSPASLLCWVVCSVVHGKKSPNFRTHSFLHPPLFFPPFLPELLF